MTVQPDSASMPMAIVWPMAAISSVGKARCRSTKPLTSGGPGIGSRCFSWAAASTNWRRRRTRSISRSCSGDGAGAAGDRRASAFAPRRRHRARIPTPSERYISEATATSTRDSDAGCVATFVSVARRRAKSGIVMSGVASTQRIGSAAYSASLPAPDGRP